MLRCLVACDTERTLEFAATWRGMRSSAAIVLDVDGFEFVEELHSDMGVDLAQGFHVGRPRPLEEL